MIRIIAAVCLLLLPMVISEYVSSNHLGKVGLSSQKDNQNDTEYRANVTSNNPPTASPTTQTAPHKPTYTQTTSQPSHYSETAADPAGGQVSKSGQGSSNNVSKSDSKASPDTQTESKSDNQPTYFKPRSYGEYLKLRQALVSDPSSIGTATSSYGKQPVTLRNSSSYSQSKTQSPPYYSESTTDPDQSYFQQLYLQQPDFQASDPFSESYPDPLNPSPASYPSPQYRQQTDPQSTSFPTATPYPQSTPYPKSIPTPQSTQYPKSTPYPPSTLYPKSSQYPPSTLYPKSTPYLTPTPRPKSDSQSTYPQSESNYQPTYPQSESYTTPTYPQSESISRTAYLQPQSHLQPTDPESQPPNSYSNPQTSDPKPPPTTPSKYHQSPGYTQTPQPPTYNQLAKPRPQPQHNPSQTYSQQTTRSSKNYPPQSYPDTPYQKSNTFPTYSQRSNSSPYYPNAKNPTPSPYSTKNYESAYPESHPVPLPFHSKDRSDHYAPSELYAGRPGVDGRSDVYDKSYDDSKSKYASKQGMAGSPRKTYVNSAGQALSRSIYGGPYYGSRQPGMTDPSSSNDESYDRSKKAYASNPSQVGSNSTYGGSYEESRQTDESNLGNAGSTSSYDRSDNSRQPGMTGLSSSYDRSYDRSSQTYVSKPGLAGPTDKYNEPYDSSSRQVYVDSNEVSVTPQYCGTLYNKSSSPPKSTDPTVFYFRSTNYGFQLKMYGEVNAHLQSVTVYSQDWASLAPLGSQESIMLVDFSQSTKIFVLKVAKAGSVGCFISELQCETDFPHLASMVDSFIDSKVVDFPYTTRLSYKADAKIDPVVYSTRTTVVNFCKDAYVWYNISPGTDNKGYTSVSVINLFGITDVYIGEM